MIEIKFKLFNSKIFKKCYRQKKKVYKYHSPRLIFHNRVGLSRLNIFRYSLTFPALCALLHFKILLSSIIIPASYQTKSSFKSPFLDITCIHSYSMEITEEQRQRAEANRRAALAKRKQLAGGQQDPWKLFKCRKVSPEHKPTFPKPQENKVPLGPIVKPQTPDQLPDKFRVRLEICSEDSFSITPEAIQGFRFPGEAHCLEKLSVCLSNVRIFFFFFFFWCGGLSFVSN